MRFDLIIDYAGRQWKRDSASQPVKLLADPSVLVALAVCQPRGSCAVPCMLVRCLPSRFVFESVGTQVVLCSESRYRSNRADTDRVNICHSLKGFSSLQQSISCKFVMEADLLVSADAKNELLTLLFMQMQQIAQRPEKVPSQ